MSDSNSQTVDLNAIKRNTQSFSFVDQLGSFINNYEFSKSFKDFKLGKDNKYTNIWSVISALGNDYAEVIYSNVIDYINNVSNVDLCKIKALRSMITVLGVDYQIVTDIANMPVELLNLMDILSINKHYLLDNKTFCDEFKEQLSIYNDGTCFLSTENNELSNEISSDISSYVAISSYLDNDVYKDFLCTVYYKTLEKYVKLQYADAENGLSTQYKYIYEYISESLTKHNSTEEDKSTSDENAHTTAINELKAKYRLYNFDYETIVDNIEDGRDSLDNYSEYQQDILSTEIDFRKSTYAYNLKEGKAQTYLSDAGSTKEDGEAQLGYQLTRYSYYREKKVKEYFNFIETTYNSLIKTSQIYSATTNSTDDVAIDIYDKDKSYFLINDSTESKLLEYDSNERQYTLNLSYISTIAELLAEQTLEISEIREQLKLQMQKTYIKGTFLLLSYIINEYLKFNIAKNFGDFTTDDGEQLDELINTSIKDGDNVEIIEYIDKTEYYNISTDFDTYIELCCNSGAKDSESDFAPTAGCNLSQNGKQLLNSKFWDSDSAKLGELTKDLPLDEIEEFYKKQLKLDEKGVNCSGDLVNFLSIIYLNGTPDTYVTEDTLNIVQKYTFSDDTVSPIVTDVLSDHTFADFKNSYESITKNAIDGYYSQIEEQLNTYQAQIDEIVASTNGLTSDEKYQQYYNEHYSDLTSNPIYFRLSALSNFTAADDNIKSKDVIDSILNLSVQYTDILSGISSLVDLSIHKTYWPLYNDSIVLEADKRLNNIESYLKSKWIDDGSVPTKQLEMISAIIYDTNLVPNNLAYLNSEFTSFVEGLGKLIEENQTIFEKYTPQTDKLYSIQIKDVYEFILKYDNDSQEELLASLSSLIDSAVSLGVSICSYLSTIDVYQADELNMFLTYSAAKAHLSEKLSKSALAYYARSDAYKYADKLLNIFTSMAEYVYGSEANIRKYSESVIMEAVDSEHCLSADVLYYPSIAAQMLIYKQQITEVCENLDTIQSLNSTFLKYSGTSNGGDPYVNIKNQTHSSYQIHPYLYNFVEYTNVAYPLANTFYASFTEDYEKQLIEDKIDNIVGIYGNPINVAKYDYKLWNGYQSRYEYEQAKLDKNVNNELQGFSGAFFKKAVFEFLDNTELFIQNVQDNTPDSYYYQLNLTQEECNKIAEQLRVYERPIREIVQRQKSSDSSQHCLSNEYDIYKYAEDYYGNSLILFKSYAYLYRQHADDPSYVPSYNEKKNAPGELWVRLNGHPIAFPAFDLRIEARDYAQYMIEEIPNMAGYELNGYIADINDYYAHVGTDSTDKSISLQELTRDSISRSLGVSSQHTRFIFDMETDTLNQSLLLVVPYQTGTNHTKKNPTAKSLDWFTYANSDIIVGYMTQEFDYDNNIHVYSFTKQSNINDVEGVTNNIDNISRPSTVSQIGCYKSDGAGGFQPVKIQKESYDFIGFAKQDMYTYVLFVHKYYQRNNGTVIDSFVNQDAPKNRKPYMTIYYVAYFSSTVVKRSLSIPLKYDVYYPSEFDYMGSGANSDDFKDARNIILCGNSKYLTIAYVSESTQQAHTGTRKTYADNTTIVNFAEYTAMVDKKVDLSSYGQNNRYPADTALLQTDDSQHVNIYNSFDSFTSYIVAVELRYIGKYLKYNQIRYYNLNADAGYTPLLADVQGTSRLYNNTALSKQTQYSCELLGPENSDVAYTPIIVDAGNTPDGRVTEDYKSIDKISYLNPAEIAIPAHSLSLEFSFDLSTVFGLDRHKESIYDQYIETGALSRYAYMFFNSTYEAMPITIGYLNQRYPTSNNYLSSEKYDSLSGEEIIGPNGISYHNLQVGNHIDYISAIDTEILFDDNKLPRSLNVSCYMRCELSNELVIPENTFRVLVYAKNNTMSYQYYHIIENAHRDLGAITQQTIKKIDFSEISSLSNYSIDGTEPFKNKGGTKYSEMSANLEFKYSENRTIDCEFPYLASEDIEDEVQSLNNDSQYIYFYALDSHKSIQIEPFMLYCYSKDSATGKMAKKINVKTAKYQDFLNQILTIQTTYNVEIIAGDEANPTYGIVLYFNYKNYTSPMYVKFKMSNSKEKYPTYSYYTSTDPELKNTYLRLEPGQNGRLDIRADFVEYAKKNSSDIQSTVIGCETKILASYYIMNVSDDKPKFLISREPAFEEY